MIRRILKVLAIIVGVVVLLFAGTYFALRPSADLREFGSLSMEWNHEGNTMDADAKNRFAERCLEVNRRHPKSQGALAAVLLAAAHTANTPAGQEAARLFAEAVEAADLDLLAGAFYRVGGNRSALEALAPAFLARLRQTPDHPRNGLLLAACCSISAPAEGKDPPPVFKEAADLLAERYSAASDIHGFCAILAGSSVSPAWAVDYEKHLRAILAVNQERFTRCTASFALARVALLAGEDRQAEAEKLFEQFCVEFDGTTNYVYDAMEKHFLHIARDELNDLRFHAVGQSVPDLSGIDLDGQPIRLSDYRGRAVLISFWGTWCFPCMKLVPHEKELLAIHRGKPFEIVGINCDDDVAKAKAAALRTEMTWRSIRNQSGDQPAITKEWKILGYPTIFLIDHHGTIRKRWVGAPAEKELQHAVGILVEAAEQRVPTEAMGPVAAALRMTPAIHFAPRQSDRARADAGFVDKVHIDADGSQSKYVVFVPPSYDSAKPAPAILYLHGSGKRGVDGRSQLNHGLPRSSRLKDPNFPFVVIIPQARPNESWLANNAGGRRALSILEKTQNEFRIDPDRIALTGHSMGGAGVWSLAAAEPKRWSAMVPVCHGGDTASAGKIAGIPCWCFHGAVDRMIPPGQSRDMIDAIAKAGGRPLYQEFPHVGHDDCAERVYEMADLFEWLTAQKRNGN
jgi:poly(3-hydroxybutyrate) depolymerase/thiol-disulfide isomerase/thioredoxin